MMYSGHSSKGNVIIIQKVLVHHTITYPSNFEGIQNYSFISDIISIMHISKCLLCIQRYKWKCTSTTHTHTHTSKYTSSKSIYVL